MAYVRNDDNLFCSLYWLVYYQGNLLPTVLYDYKLRCGPQCSPVIVDCIYTMFVMLLCYLLLSSCWCLYAIVCNSFAVHVERMVDSG